MAIVGSDKLVTAGSDFLIYVWDGPTFDLLGTIPVQSTAIIAIAGCHLLGLIVCMNAERRVFVCWLDELKTEFSFATGIEVEAKHRLLLLENGLIAITCESTEDKAEIWFFTLRGKNIGRVMLCGKICKIFGITTAACETFVIATLSTQTVAIINGTDCTGVAILDETAVPDLVTAFDNTRRLIIVSPKNPRKPFIVRF
jgi:hypothetical protein